MIVCGYYNKKHVSIVIGVMFLLIGLLSVSQVDAAGSGVTTKIYWAENGGTVHRADLDGSNNEDLGVGSNAWGLAVDDVNGKIYWTDFSGGTIGWSDLDGSNPETILTGLSSPSGVAIDAANNHLYYIEASTIKRADLDGSNVSTLVTGVSGGSDIALDLTNSHMYWTEFYDDAVMRADLDGNTVTPLVSTTDPTGIALDVPNNKIYWGLYNSGKFQMADLDGGNAVDLETGLNQPIGILVDANSSKIYYSDRTKVIRQAGLDGSAPEDLLNIGNGYGVHGIALGSESVPRILTVTPENDSQNVSPSTNITITLNESVSPDLAPVVVCGAETIGHTSTKHSGDTVYIFHPSAFLPASSSCTLTIYVSLYKDVENLTLLDDDGNTNGIYTVTFQTGTMTQVLDLNQDGIISPSDVVYVSNRLDTADLVADVNDDSVVDITDVNMVVAALGTTLP